METAPGDGLGSENVVETAPVERVWSVVLTNQNQSDFHLRC